MIRSLSLKQGYLLGLLLILILATFKYFAVEKMIADQGDAATLINLSGYQRMLSQRTALFAAEYFAVSDDRKTTAKTKLKNTINEFSINHHALIHGDMKRGIPALSDQDILDTYYQGQPSLDEMVKAYIEAALSIIEEDTQTQQKTAALNYILNTGPTILLEKLDRVVSLYESKAQKDVELISNVQKLFWFGTFIILILEALFLFQPLIKRIEISTRELQKQKDQIKDQLVELEGFTHITSHDLQEPLRKIVSYTGKLEQKLSGTLDSNTQEYLKFIKQGSLHMRDLVTGLHHYANIFSEQHKTEDVDSQKSLANAMDGLEELIDNSQTVINAEDLPIVHYNKKHLSQIFEHLIENAIKFKSDQTPIINITASKQSNEWVFCVCDNGIGIEEKYLDRIFEMFQRLHHKDNIPGTGIGLTLAKKIVTRHHGRIWIQSMQGSGTNIYFTIPLDA